MVDEATENKCRKRDISIRKAQVRKLELSMISTRLLHGLNRSKDRQVSFIQPEFVYVYPT